MVEGKFKITFILLNLFLLILLLGVVNATSSACPLNQDDYDYVIEFNSNKLFSNSKATKAESALIPVSLGAGKYTVTLVSEDSYSNRINAFQKNEQYFLLFFKDNSQVASTPPTTDLEDNVISAQVNEIVTTNLVLKNGADKIQAKHAFYPDTTSANSLIAVCAGINKNICGDGKINQNSEQCDDGNNDNFDGCSATCQIEEYCGDGVCSDSESCSDCEKDCGICLSDCGNNINETGEECDWGNLNGFLCWASYGKSCQYCTDSCKLKIVFGGYCGDGVRDPCYEECDDGNKVNGDGCSSTCEIENIAPVCGDKQCNGEETCESCPIDCGTCPVEPICGDGEVNQISEQCDDGNNINGDGCSSTCQIEVQSICGNKILELNEECDDGIDNGKGCDNSKKDCEYCSTTCKIIERKEKDNNKISTTGYKLIGDFCITNWECSGWSKCQGNLKTRECIDKNNCKTEYNKPAESASCNIISNSLVKEEPKNNFPFLLLFGIINLIILLIVLFKIIK